VNVYHITYGPATKIVQIHFWGCNLSCRACLLKREIYDCHLVETKDRIFQGRNEVNRTPDKFLDMEEVMQWLNKLEVGEVIFMGAEPALDPQLPALAGALHRKYSSHNVLLTNGFQLPDLSHIDEIVFSIKAHTDTIHRDYTGTSNKKALDNFITLYKSGIKLRTESVYIPEYIDGPEIENIARFIAGVDRSIPYRIDAYLPIGDNPWRRPIPREIKDAASLARKRLLDVSYLTGNEDLKYEVIRIF
jgi:pyruvate-formate lyase-activating enzyme